VAVYQLSVRAARELDEIFAFGAMTFGLLQAERYLASLENVFALLAANPLLGRSSSYLGPGIRRHAHGSHAIIYRPAAEGVVILAVIHGQSSQSRLW